MVEDWDDVVAYALTLPDTYLESYYGTPCPKVNKKAFAAPGREAGSFCMMVDIGEKGLLMETDPDTFWQTPHYDGWPGILVRYGRARDRVETYLQRGWWDRASKAQREAFGKRP